MFFRNAEGTLCAEIALQATKESYMRISILFFLLLTLALPASAHAGGQEFKIDAFSATLPPGWKAEQQMHNYVEFSPEDGSALVVVSFAEISLIDGPLLARSSMSRGSLLRALPDPQGFVSLENGRHRWMNVSKNPAKGWLLYITTSAYHKDIPAFLNSLEGSSATPELQELFASLQLSPDAANWLAHSGKPVPGTDLSPLAGAPLPDLATFGAMPGEGGKPPVARNSFPEGWTLATVGLWTVARHVGGVHWCAARYYDLPATEDDHPVFAIAKLVGGKNIIFAEGRPDFVTPVGFTSLDCSEGSPCMLTIFSDAATVYDVYISTE